MGGWGGISGGQRGSVVGSRYFRDKGDVGGIGVLTIKGGYGGCE